MTKKKANVRPELIGNLFTDGDVYWRLTDCQREPTATIEAIQNPEVTVTKPISKFSNLVLMKPIRPIEKAKKPRSDIGTKRVGKRLEPEPTTAITPELSEGLTLLKSTKKKSKWISSSKPDISTFSITTPAPNSSKPHYTLSLGGVGFACLTLKAGVTEMLALSGIDQKYVEDAPDSEGKRQLLDILNPTP